jgi:hypothetical protein
MLQSCKALVLEFEHAQGSEEESEDENEDRHDRVKIAAKEGHFDHRGVEIDVAGAELVFLHTRSRLTQHNHVVETADSLKVSHSDRSLTMILQHMPTTEES